LTGKFTLKEFIHYLQNYITVFPILTGLRNRDASINTHLATASIPMTGCNADGYCPTSPDRLGGGPPYKPVKQALPSTRKAKAKWSKF
jgi:hypothetical protein